MSAASQILSVAADAMASVHADDLTLKPANVVVSGYAQDLSVDPQESGIPKTRAPKMFHVGEDLITHIVWIRRSLLMAVTLSGVASIEQSGTTKKYRVKHVSDDPNNAEVAFFTVMS